MTVLPLTLIIPTLNEKNNVNKIIKNIKTLKCKEVIIVDGGSKDETCILLKNYKLINSYASRGKQLHLGAINSSEDLNFEINLVEVTRVEPISSPILS